MIYNLQENLNWHPQSSRIAQSPKNNIIRRNFMFCGRPRQTKAELACLLIPSNLICRADVSTRSVQDKLCEYIDLCVRTL
jgi:hypothetical protein